MPGRQNRLHATSPHMRQRRHRGSWLGSPRCSSLQQDSCWPRLLSAPCVSSWPQTAGGVSAEPVSSICGSGEAEVGKSMACRRCAWLVAAAVPPGRGALPALSPSGCFTSFLNRLRCCSYCSQTTLKMHYELSCAVSFSFAASSGKCLPVSTADKSLRVVVSG